MKAKKAIEPTIEDRATEFLNKTGIQKEDILPGIWIVLRMRTVEMLQKGMEEKHIVNKLGEIVLYRTNLIREYTDNMLDKDQIPEVVEVV
jgi:hypothetical protein